ncbi:MAG: sugar phosphate isomerase/epimerase family protein [Candidatus Hodarchaeota archaeon]
MKLCFNAAPEPVEEYFPFAKANDFPWIELSCNNPKNFLSTFTAERISTIKNLRDKYQVRYGLHSASYVNSAEIEPTVRKAVEQYLLGYVELAHRLEAEYLVLHLGYHFSLFMDEVFKCLIQTFTPVAELAEKYDIPIGIENMNKIHEDAEIAYLGVTIEELSRVFKALPTKYLGLTLDVAHASLLPGGPESFIKAFPDRIVSTHISDNDLYLDRHVPVGEGKIDFRKVFELLISIDFKGTLNIELKTNKDRLLSKQRLEIILKDLGIRS